MRHSEAEWLKAIASKAKKKKKEEARIHICEEINKRPIKEIYNKCQQYVQHCAVLVYMQI